MVRLCLNCRDMEADSCGCCMASCRQGRHYVDCGLHRSLEFNARFTDCGVSTDECSGRLTAGTQPHSMLLVVDPGCTVTVD